MSGILVFVVIMSGKSGIFILQIGQSYDICFNQPDEVVVGGKQTNMDKLSSIFLYKII